MILCDERSVELNKNSSRGFNRTLPRFLANITLFFNLNLSTFTTYCIKSFTWISFCLIRVSIVNFAQSDTRIPREKKIIHTICVLRSCTFCQRTTENLLTNVSQPTEMG